MPTLSSPEGQSRVARRWARLTLAVCFPALAALPTYSGQMVGANEPVARLSATSPEAFALSSDGKTLALGGRSDNIQLLAVGMPARVVHVDGSAERISALQFSPDGKRLLVGLSTRAVMVDSETGRPLSSLEIKSGNSQLVTSRDLSHVVTARRWVRNNLLLGLLGVAVTLNPYGGLAGVQDKSEVRSFEYGSRARRLMKASH